jgi:hypothetical protein
VACWWVRGLVVLALLCKLLQGKQAHGSCVLSLLRAWLRAWL